MIRVLHIHTDPKFLELIPVFDDRKFENDIIFISSDEVDLSKRYPGYVISYYKLNRKALKEVIKKANEVDLVVCYMMEITTSYICNRLNNNVRVIWRFFGAELYGLLGLSMFSDATKAVLPHSRPSLFKRLNFLFNSLILYGIWYRKEKGKAMMRADAVAMLYKEEYEYLNQKFKLPSFIQLPYERDRIFSNFDIKDNLIIIGNSRNRFNNHLDVIQMIKDSNSESYRYEMPFNYGEESRYTEAVRKAASEIQGLHIINDFMPLEEYSSIFQKASAFVFNAYRQMAMGNIFIAIQNNVKVYLSTQNTAYDWLLREGFKVFSIDDFAKDLRNGNVTLNEEDSIFNRNAFDSLSKKYNNKFFENSIIKSIKNK